MLVLCALDVAVNRAQPPPPPSPPVSPQVSIIGPSGSSMLRGRITASSTGDRLRHVRVAATAATGALPATLTDEDGAYAIGPLPRGRYSVAVSKPGYVKQMSNVTVGEAGAAPLDLSLVQGAVISGVVLDDVGEPVVGMTVGVARLNARAAQLRATTIDVAQTDDTGAFRIAGLAAGDNYLVHISARMPGYLPGGPASNTRGATSDRGRPGMLYYPGTADLSAAARLTLRPGDERAGLTFSLPPSLPPAPLSADSAVVTGRAAPAPTDPGATSVEQDAKATAVIKGRVLKAGGGGLASAQVVALIFSGTSGTPSGRPIVAASTGADGSYELTVPNVVPGDQVRVTANKAVYQSADLGQRTPGTRGDPIPVNPGEVLDHADIVLQRLGVIVGRIVDDLGEPVEGAAVRPAQLRYVNGRRRLVDVGAVRRTDDLGRYRLFGLRPGQYAVSASVGQIVVAQPSEDLPGYGTTYFPGVADPQAAQFVRIEAADEVPGADFPMARMTSARVSGKALDAEGNPISGGIALMPSLRSGADTEIQMGARIDRDGGFEFPNVPAGDYVLQVLHGRSNSNEGEFAYRFVTVTDGDIGDLDIETTPGSTLTGNITSDGGEIPRLDDIQLMAVPVDADRSPRAGGPPARANILPDGQFELMGIHGPRRLQVVRAPAGWTMRSVLVGGVDVTDQVLSFGRDDESLEDIQVVMTSHVTEIIGNLDDPGIHLGGFAQPGGQSGGQLGGQAARRLEDVAVLAFAADRNLWYQGSRFRKRAAATADGRFRIEGLPPADYFVVAGQPPRDPGEWLDPDVLERLSRDAARVRLTDGEHVSVAVKPLSPQ